MRRTLRLFAAAVKPVSARYLEAGAPTGLTGLMTHGSPRSTLLYLYSSTLEKLQAAPEHSVYRQSVEAVTKHRMGLVEGVVPEGHAAWAARARDVFAQHPEQFSIAGGAHADGGATLRVERGGRSFVVRHVRPVIDERLQEWDGEIGGGQLPDEAVTRVPLEEQVKWEPEPQLTADQWVSPLPPRTHDMDWMI